MNETSHTTPLPDPNVYYGQSIVPIAVVTITLSTLLVGLRFWSRAIILRVFVLEDWFILLGWVRLQASSSERPTS